MGRLRSDGAGWYTGEEGASAEAEAVRGRKRGLRRRWGRDGTRGDKCVEGVGGTRGRNLG